MNKGLKLILNISRRSLAIWRVNHLDSIQLTLPKSLTLTRHRIPKILSFFPVVTALSFKFRKGDENIAEKNVDVDDQVIIDEADEIYKSGNVDQLYVYLSQYQASDNADILWRLCRAMRDKAAAMENEAKQKQLIYEAFECIQLALEIDDENFAVHKWYAIMLSKVGEYEGTKQQLKNSYEIKEHFMEAVELNPRDATSIHLLGVWCFTFADLPWHQRKIASVIFATPPSSSYEEALQYFQQAETVDPNFYSSNLLMLGKTFMRLKQTDDAVRFLERARDFPIKTVDDHKAHDEAVELLKQLGR